VDFNTDRKRVERGDISDLCVIVIRCLVGFLNKLNEFALRGSKVLIPGIIELGLPIF
jgi:hypothetical protein